MEIKRIVENNPNIRREVKENISGEVNLEKNQEIINVLTSRIKRPDLILEKAGESTNNLNIESYDINLILENTQNVLDRLEEIVEEDEIQEDNVLDFLRNLTADKDFKGFSINMIKYLIEEDRVEYKRKN